MTIVAIFIAFVRATRPAESAHLPASRVPFVHAAAGHATLGLASHTIPREGTSKESLHGFVPQKGGPQDHPALRRGRGRRPGPSQGVIAQVIAKYLRNVKNEISRASCRPVRDGCQARQQDNSTVVRHSQSSSDPLACAMVILGP